MQITKNKLQSGGVPSLTAISDNYQIRLFYNGDYIKDFAERNIDKEKIMLTCKALTTDVPQLTIFDGHIAISNTLPTTITLHDMDKFMDRLLKARNDMASLQLIYDTYFNPGC